MSDTVTTVNLSDDPTSVVLGDLLAAVQDTSSADALNNVDITFTCKVCKAKKSNLKELIAHLSSKECSETPKPTPRKRGRPPKSKNVTKTYAAVAKQTESADGEKTVPSGNESLVTEKDGLIPTVASNSMPFSRLTRINSGAIKRKSALELLGISDIKEEPFSDDDSSDKNQQDTSNVEEVFYVPPVKRGRGRPRKTSLIQQSSPRKAAENQKEEQSPNDDHVNAPEESTEKEVSKDPDPIPCGGENTTESGTKLDEVSGELSGSGNAVADANAGSFPSGEGYADENDTEVSKSLGEKSYDKEQTLVIKLTKKTTEDDDEQTEDDVEDLEAKLEDTSAMSEDVADEEVNDNLTVTILCPRTKKLKCVPIQKQFPCPECNQRRFPSEEELKVHLEIHNDPDPHSPQRFKCLICGFAQNNWNRVLAHLLTHEDYRKVFKNSCTVMNIYGKFSCKECGKLFKRKTALMTHARSVHQKPNHTCDVCGKTFLSTDDKVFQRHLDKCKNVEMKCTECDYCTNVSANLKLHMRVHRGKGFICEVCDTVYPTKQRYTVHSLTHQENRTKYICDVCNQAFKTQDGVRKHAARFHAGITSRAWHCTMCSYVGKLEYDLKKHIQQVHEKRYRCEQCPFATNAEGQMELHKTYHSPDCVCPCPYAECYFSTTGPEALAEHVSTKHNLQYKNQCPICLKRFKKKTVLLRHLITHTGDKPYLCQECGLSFYSHSSYYRHKNKTGHDAKREGVVSIPQNITIQYMDDIPDEEAVPSGVESGAVISDVESVLKLATHEANRAQQLISSNVVQVHVSGPSYTPSQTIPQATIASTDNAILLEGSAPGEVLRAETIGDSIVVQHPHRVISQLDSSNISNTVVSMENLAAQQKDGYVTELTGTEISIPQNGLPNQQYIIETSEGVTDEDLEQITYVLQVDENSTMNGSVSNLALNEGYQILQHLKQADQPEVIPQEEMPMNVQTVLQMGDTAGEQISLNGEQYSVVMLQESGDEPEAALSMLQLQSGDTAALLSNEQTVQQME